MSNYSVENTSKLKTKKNHSSATGLLCLHPAFVVSVWLEAGMCSGRFCKRVLNSCHETVLPHIHRISAAVSSRCTKV